MKSKTRRLLLSLSLMLGMALATRAQLSTPELKASEEKWWAAYTEGMKKVDAQKDDQQAALLLKNLKTELLPQFSQLVRQAAGWKKAHSATEIKELEAWTNANPHYQQQQEWQLNPKLMQRASKSPQFRAAYSDWIKSLAMAGKGAK